MVVMSYTGSNITYSISIGNEKGEHDLAFFPTFFNLYFVLTNVINVCYCVCNHLHMVSAHIGISFHMVLSAAVEDKAKIFEEIMGGKSFWWKCVGNSAHLSVAFCILLIL